MSANFYHIYIVPKNGILRDQVEKKMNLAIDWYRYNDTNWVVYTTSNAEQWYSRLKDFVVPDGNLFIVKLEISERFGFMNKGLWTWIKAKGV